MDSTDARQLRLSEFEFPRDTWTTLSTKDNALALVEASSSGDLENLHNLLSQAEWAKIALEEQEIVHGKVSDRLTTVPMSNLHRALLKAVLGGHTPIVSTLLAFAWENGVDRDSVITRFVVSRALDRNRLDVFEALILADPTVVNFNVHHGYRPLNITVRRRDTKFVALLLRHGAPLEHPDASERGWSYSGSYLCQSIWAEGTRMTELLLQYGASVAQSGALHFAAERGKLESMRLLLQYGADVNELLPADTLSPRFSKVLASWTPLHFAAAKGQIAAMKLLESNGAKSDLVDQNGKIPAQLLEEGCQDVKLASL